MAVNKSYRIQRGGVHEAIDLCRLKIQVFGGGFANGKTTALVMKALKVCEGYPGCNILLARETYPKLNDTLRKEFLKWCPAHWIKRYPTKDDNTCVLKNGSTINFRYIAQQGKNNETTTSNTLSATYDFIGIDQCEDPGIIYKDVLDMLGRLRGDARYTGNDPTMPKTGPRWLMLTANPTGGWVYQKLVRPMEFYAKKRMHPDLLVDPKTKKPIIGIFNASTYENADNLAEDYIQSLEIAYTGQQKDRYLDGKWVAYEGLVYSRFNLVDHVLMYDQAMDYLAQLRRHGIQVQWLQGYDHGIAAPSCYIMGFVDHRGNVIYCDGFYEKEMGVLKIGREINKLRKKYNLTEEHGIYADPDIFKRRGDIGETIGGKLQLGDTTNHIAALPVLHGQRDIKAGIEKIQGYINIQEMHRNPITNAYGAPYFYCTDNLTWLHDEFAGYMWKKNNTGETTDEPVDKNDHALDALKYSMTPRPKIAQIVRIKRRLAIPNEVQKWSELRGDGDGDQDGNNMNDRTQWRHAS